MKRLLLNALLLLAFLAGCKEKPDPQLTNKDIAKVLEQMTQLMIHDVSNPPLASRFYAYACISGYTVLALNDSTIVPLKGVLNEYPDVVKPLDSGRYSYQLSAILAMTGTAKKMQPSGKEFNKFEQRFLDSCRNIGFSDKVIAASQSYANQVVKQILAYAKKDRYNRISNYPRYTPLNTEGSWYPTPPAYFAPVEPYFNTVRPFFIDSAEAFKSVPPVPYSKDKNSDFFKMLTANYVDGGSGLTPEHREIAAFWDCNPFALKNEGHLLIGLKKISPGAHWVGITGIACQKANVGFSKTLEIYTVVAAGLTDSFISCWDEKYRSNRIRPETAIRRLIDPKWKPMLQTPPFPEYMSGHSHISSTTATILTYYFGDNFSYTDNVEEKYGLKSRKFASFNEAAKEAAMSRYWGGIHFKDGIINGVDVGNAIGKHIVDELKTSHIRPVGN
ncbi:vanadium-dependent haloperoxidase [Pedobacter sp. JY14-1]|uniref:vanadium-dependent haloperoxidase n=1 Tax=Pedobacter sp. JY14-1 TaxID=3034151 RepID=UPI0023E1BD3A|nr:vanadium-dependent haloperoxidase [Pedobacter sp. JY14-1]